MRVALFATCLADSFFADSAFAAVRVLQALGVDVVVPRAQTCCGQPAFNAGHRHFARKMAEHTLEVFCDADAVVLPSGSCAAMIRHHYTDLCGRSGDFSSPDVTAIRMAERTWELTEFIVKVLGVTEVGTGLHGTRVAYHHGCHALRELRVRDEPLTLLRNAGATIVDWNADEECCGFGGVFAVKMPEVSLAMADRKIDSLVDDNRREDAREHRAPIDVLTSTDGGCLLQLSGRMRRRGVELPVQHIADLLWRALQVPLDAASAAASRPAVADERSG